MSDFTDSIHAMLKNSPFGSAEQKRGAMLAAREIDQAPGKIGDVLRMIFIAWVQGKKYLMPSHDDVRDLNATMLRSDVEVAREYGLTSPRAVEHRQEWISAARQERIDRAVRHAECDWDVRDACKTFCAAADEWEAVYHRCGIVFSPGKE